MKIKTLISFAVQDGQFYSRELGRRTNADFIFVADLPGGQGTFYASSVQSALSNRYPENQMDVIKELELYKKKGERYFKVSCNDGRSIELTNQKYALLFLTVQEEYQAKGEPSRDNVLLFNLPGTLADSHMHFCFKDDKEEQGLIFFWLSKEFI